MHRTTGTPRWLVLFFSSSLERGLLGPRLSSIIVQVAVKVLRPVGLDGYSESESLQRMIAVRSSPEEMVELGFLTLSPSFKRASREAHAWLAIYHPNVVPLVGYTFTPLLSLVSPWHERGNIRSYLNLNPDADRMKLVCRSNSRPPPVRANSVYCSRALGARYCKGISLPSFSQPARRTRGYQTCRQTPLYRHSSFDLILRLFWSKGKYPDQ